MKHLRSRLLGLSLLLLAACSQTPVGHSDTPTVLKPLNFGTPQQDIASALAHHSSGIYVIGTTQGRLHSAPKQSIDIFIRKHDTSGRLLWGRQFGTTETDSPIRAASDADDNVYIAGYTYGALAGSQGVTDGFVRKYSSSGTVLWTRQFGTRTNDYATGVVVHRNSVYVVGVTDNLNGLNYTAFIQQFSTDGRSLWQRFVRTPYLDFAYDVATDSQGNAYVLGIKASRGATPDGNQPLFLRKYTPDGDIVWTREFRGDAFNLAVDGSSLYVAGLKLDLNSYTERIRISKFSTNGLKLWDKTVGMGSGTYLFDLSACAGIIALSGWVTSEEPDAYDTDGFVLKLTSQGSRVWLRKQESRESDTTSAVLVSSSGIYAAGDTWGKIGETVYGKGDAFLTRLRSSNGTTVWVK